MPPNTFSVRDAGAAPNDVDFIIAAFDSTIPVLISTGNSGMWGTELFSAKDGFAKVTKEDVEQSQKFRLTGQGEATRQFIAQVEETDKTDETTEDGLSRWTDENGCTFLSAGMVTVFEDRFVKHILNHATLKEFCTAATAVGEFLWIDVLVTDYRIGSKRKGAGDALLHKVVEHAKERGKKTVYVDCWTGGTAKLVE